MTSFLRKRNDRLRTATLLCAICLTGCGPDAPVATKSTRRAFEATAISVGVPPGGAGEEIAFRSKSWASRTGAALSIVVSPGATLSTDLTILTPASAGSAAARGDLAALPDALRQSTHPLQWLRILPPYRNALGVWGRDFVALPVAGDAPVFAYRKDRFADPAFQRKLRDAGGRDPAPPATWEELAEFARRASAAEGRPVLAPLPADGGLGLFHLIAACHDRRALSEAEAGRGIAVAAATEADLSFHFDLVSGKPRLTAPGFVAAAEWLRDTRSFRAAGADPAAALADGSALCGVLTLDELARVPAALRADGRLGVARLPGAARVFGRNGEPLAVPGPNFVPYFGSDAKLAVVKKGSAAADAAWDLAAELAGVQGALAALATPGAGAGPFRTEQVEEGRAPLWLAYDFDAAGTKELAAAARGFAALSVTNPVVAPRLPDGEAFQASLGAAVAKAARGEVEPRAALAAADAEWAARAAKVPEFRALLRKGAGLE